MELLRKVQNVIDPKSVDAAHSITSARPGDTAGSFSVTIITELEVGGDSKESIQSNPKLKKINKSKL